MFLNFREQLRFQWSWRIKLDGLNSFWHLLNRRYGVFDWLCSSLFEPWCWFLGKNLIKLIFQVSFQLMVFDLFWEFLKIYAFLIWLWEIGIWILNLIRNLKFCIFLIYKIYWAIFIIILIKFCLWYLNFMISFKTLPNLIFLRNYRILRVKKRHID